MGGGVRLNAYTRATLPGPNPLIARNYWINSDNRYHYTAPDGHGYLFNTAQYHHTTYDANGYHNFVSVPQWYSYVRVGLRLGELKVKDAWWYTDHPNENADRFIDRNLWINEQHRLSTDRADRWNIVGGKNYTSESTYRHFHDALYQIKGSEVTVPNNTPYARIVQSGFKAKTHPNGSDSRITNAWTNSGKSSDTPFTENDVEPQATYMSFIRSNHSTIDYIITEDWILRKDDIIKDAWAQPSDKYGEATSMITIHGNHNDVNIIIDARVETAVSRTNGWDNVIRLVTVNGTGNRVLVHFTRRGRFIATINIDNPDYNPKSNDVNIVGYRPDNTVIIRDWRGQCEIHGQVPRFSPYWKLIHDRPIDRTVTHDEYY